MRDEVTTWLKENNFEVGILVKKWKFSTLAIIEASEAIYDKIHVGGEKIKQIKIGWRIRSIAQAIDSRQDIQEIKDLKSAHQIIQGLKEDLKSQQDMYQRNYSSLNQAKRAQIKVLRERIRELERPWYSKVWRKHKGYIS